MLHIKIIDSSKNEKIEISKAEKFLFLQSNLCLSTFRLTS